jgi:hypothetical protein
MLERIFLPKKIKDKTSAASHITLNLFLRCYKNETKAEQESTKA